MLLQIGEFARLTGLPVRTVRYYGNLGLLPPAVVDPSTGYRKYRIDQVDRASRLSALKEIGLPLDEIRRILDDELDDREFRDALAGRVAALERESAHITRQLQRARVQLDHVNQRLERTMPDVTIKTTDATTIAFVREQIGGIAEIAPLFPKLFSMVDPTVGVGPGGNVYHYFADDGSSIDVEAVLPVPDDFQAIGPVQTRVIPATQVASVIHHGAFNRLHQAHSDLFAWVEANGWTVSGPSYEWNLVCTEPVSQDNETYVTDVQVEVTKA